MSSILSLMFITNAHYTAPAQQICIKLYLGIRYQVRKRKLQIEVTLVINNSLVQYK